MKFKVEMVDLKTKQSDLESKVKVISEEIGFNHDHGRDLQILMDPHEQCSSKKSIRIRGVKEEMGEDIEQVPLETSKKNSIWI